LDDTLRMITLNLARSFMVKGTGT